MVLELCLFTVGFNMHTKWGVGLCFGDIQHLDGVFALVSMWHNDHNVEL